MSNFYIVHIWWDSFRKQGGYKVLKVCKSLTEAAETLPTLRTSWCVPIVRDGKSGHRYCYADLVDSWTGKPKEV